MPANKTVVAVPLVGTSINDVVPGIDKDGKFRLSKHEMRKTMASMPHIAAARMPAVEPELVDTLDNTPVFNPTAPVPGTR